MRRKILVIGLALAMFTAQTAVFAQDNDVQDNTQIVDSMPVFSANYIKSEMTLSAVGNSDDLLKLEGNNADGELINAIILDKTLIFDNAGNEFAAADLKEGVKVSLYTNVNEPMTLQLPVTYRPAVVIVETENAGFVDVDTYGADGVNAANTLQINDADKTGDLIVFYTVSSRSIPALTTPSKVVSIPTGADSVGDGERPAEVDYTKVKNVVVNGTAENMNIVVFNGNLMLPVRQICEKMNYTVAWDSELAAVAVGSVPMGVNFVVGKNEYNKARMAAQQLSSAPIIVAADEVIGLTYVPVEFFSEILDAALLVENDTLFINQY